MYNEYSSLSSVHRITLDGLKLIELEHKLQVMSCQRGLNY